MKRCVGGEKDQVRCGDAACRWKETTAGTSVAFRSDGDVVGGGR